MEKTKQVRHTERIIIPWTLEDAEHIIEAANVQDTPLTRVGGHEVALCLEVLLYGARRCGEIIGTRKDLVTKYKASMGKRIQIGLRPMDLVVQSDKVGINFYIEKKYAGLNERSQGFTELPTDTMQKLINYCKEKNIQSDQPIFKIKYSTLNRKLKEACKRANLPLGNPHWLRHVFASHALTESHGDIAAVRDLLCHSDFAQVSRYTDSKAKYRGIWFKGKDNTTLEENKR